MTKEWFAYKLYVYDLDDTLYRETDYLFAAYSDGGYDPLYHHEAGRE